MGDAFGDKINRALDRRGWRQANLARATGLATTAISRMVNGDQRPYAHQAVAIADALGVSLDYLLRDEVPEPDSARDLSLRERQVVDIVRRIGEDEALARLLLAGRVAVVEDGKGAPSPPAAAPPPGSAGRVVLRQRDLPPVPEPDPLEQDRRRR